LFINDIAQRCPACMRPLDETAACLHCSTPAQTEQPAPLLPLRTLLAQGRFGIGRAVEQNGDGITYLAFDAQYQKTVYVREFFPAAIAVRGEDLVPLVMQGCETTWQECLQNFTALWRNLLRLRGLSALLAVTDVFEENGTVYAVYDHSECVTFREFLLRSKQGNITWDRARSLLMPVLSTLGSLHQQGILHRGISPTTLFYGTDGKVRIGGFSIWQARTAHGELNANIADGYAALEQYGVDGKQGAWTDIYAFAAVLYRALVGTDPDDAVSRRHNDRLMVPAQIAERIPAYVLNALINAMQVFPEDRTRTVEQFRAELTASPAAVHQSATQRIRHSTSNIPQVQAPTPQADDSKFLALKIAGIILGAGIVVTIIFLLIYPATRESMFGLFEGQTTTAPVVTQPMEYEVPDFAGMLLEEVEDEFSTQFQFAVRYAYHDTMQEGYVTDQSIAPGEQVPPGTAITLFVSSGPGTEIMPNVVGRNVTQVRQELQALGFVVDIGTPVANSDPDRVNTVEHVSLTEGQRHLRGSRVLLRVWGEVDN